MEVLQAHYKEVQNVKSKMQKGEAKFCYCILEPECFEDRSRGPLDNAVHACHTEPVWLERLKRGHYTLSVLQYPKAAITAISCLCLGLTCLSRHATQLMPSYAPDR